MLALASASEPRVERVEWACGREGLRRGPRRVEPFAFNPDFTK
jgi:hypothetical protein